MFGVPPTTPLDFSGAITLPQLKRDGTEDDDRAMEGGVGVDRYALWVGKHALQLRHGDHS